MNRYVRLLTSIRFNQGRIGEVVPLIHSAVTASPKPRPIPGESRPRPGPNGDLAAAGTILGRLVDNRVAALRRDWRWYGAMISLADAAEMTDQLDAAAELDEQLTPYSGRLAHPVAGVGHPIHVALAQLALTRSDNQRAETIA